MTPQASKKSLPLAVAWMVGALSAFLMMAIAGRELSAEIGPAQMVAYRNIICLAVLLSMLAAMGVRHAHTAKPGRHLMRGAVHFLAQLAWFYAIARIPIAEVFAIEFTTPIWTAMIGVMLFGERMNAMRVAAISLGFIGVLVILRPGVAIVNIAALAALASAFGFALTYAFTKDLVGTDKPFAILVWMNAVQLPMSLAVAGPVWVTPSEALWPWVCAMGLTGLVSHYCLSRALECGDMSVVVPIDFLRVPAAAVVAWMLYGELVSPAVFVGSVLIFCGVWLNLRRT